MKIPKPEIQGRKVTVTFGRKGTVTGIPLPGGGGVRITRDEAERLLKTHGDKTPFDIMCWEVECEGDTWAGVQAGDLEDENEKMDMKNGHLDARMRTFEIWSSKLFPVARKLFTRKAVEEAAKELGQWFGRRTEYGGRDIEAEREEEERYGRGVKIDVGPEERKRQRVEDQKKEVIRVANARLSISRDLTFFFRREGYPREVIDLLRFVLRRGDYAARRWSWKTRKDFNVDVAAEFRTRTKGRKA